MNVAFPIDPFTVEAHTITSRAGEALDLEAQAGRAIHIDHAFSTAGIDVTATATVLRGPVLMDPEQGDGDVTMWERPVFSGQSGVGLDVGVVHRDVGDGPSPGIFLASSPSYLNRLLIRDAATSSTLVGGPNTWANFVQRTVDGEVAKMVWWEIKNSGVFRFRCNINKTNLAKATSPSRVWAAVLLYGDGEGGNGKYDPGTFNTPTANLTKEVINRFGYDILDITDVSNNGVNTKHMINFNATFEGRPGDSIVIMQASPAIGSNQYDAGSRMLLTAMSLNVDS